MPVAVGYVQKYEPMTAKPTTEDVRAALGTLDGSVRAAVRLLADVTDDDIDDLGGLPDA